MTRLIGGPFSAERVRDRLAGEIDLMAAQGIQYWPIFRLGDGAHVGCAGLHPYRPQERVYEMGFHLRPAVWGQGFAVEAGRAVIAVAFERFGAEAIFAGHHPDNGASRAVLKKLGFHFTHEERYPPTGLLHPSYLLTRP